jgi:hypothetical protein
MTDMITTDGHEVRTGDYEELLKEFSKHKGEYFIIGNNFFYYTSLSTMMYLPRHAVINSVSESHA